MRMVVKLYDPSDNPSDNVQCVVCNAVGTVSYDTMQIVQRDGMEIVCRQCNRNND